MRVGTVVLVGDKVGVVTKEVVTGKNSESMVALNTGEPKVFRDSDMTEVLDPVTVLASMCDSILALQDPKVKDALYKTKGEK